jgi:hypothetical protein
MLLVNRNLAFAVRPERAFRALTLPGLPRSEYQLVRQDMILLVDSGRCNSPAGIYAGRTAPFAVSASRYPALRRDERPTGSHIQPIAQTLADASTPQDLALPWAAAPDIGVEKVLVPCPFTGVGGCWDLCPATALAGGF